MRAHLVIALSLALFACRTSRLGACSADSDCQNGARCDTTQDVPICVVPQGGCFPSCPAGQVCQNATCVASTCTPACTSSQVCESGTCTNATSASVAITTPVSGAIADQTLQATATAAAPGGVSALKFELLQGGSVVKSAAASASSSDPSHFAASISLAGVPDGASQLRAVATYGQETATSPLVAVTVDQHAPTFTSVTDGRTTLLAGGATATVQATISDGNGSGVSSATLTVSGQQVTGSAGTGGVYTFPVALTDALAPASTTTQLTYTISATDGAGHTGTLSGDPREVLLVDRDAPVIDQIAVVTAADFTATDGGAFYDNGSTPLTITARIRDGAGLASSSLCLTADGDTGACPHAATSLGSSQYKFSLPRRSGDGTTPIHFTISAADALAATANAPAEHTATSAPQPVLFDDQPPAIAVSADSTWYALKLPDGGSDVLSVSATISDPTGIGGTPQLTSGATVLNAASSSGSTYVFNLPALAGDGGVESALAFQVSAADRLGHVGHGTGSRNIDGAPPAASVQIYKDAPDAGTGVTYPAAVTGTGWDGTQFVYSDTVHVKGTLSDSSGLGAASLHVDGILSDGGVATGTALPLGCTAGQTTCAFDVQVTLNDAGTEFHSGSAMHQMGDLNAPSAPLQITIDAADQARAGDGGTAAHAGSSATAAQTTRLLWQMYLPASVSGLAVHPDGDLVVTLDGGTDTVYDLAPDQPLVRWTYGSDAGTSGLGAIPGEPAVGQGSASTAPIYVASAAGVVQAISPAGASLWRRSTGQALAVGPAVASASNNGTAFEQVLVPGIDATTPNLYGASQGAMASAAINDVAASSAPLVLGGSVFFGTASDLEGFPLSSTGGFGTAATASGLNFLEVMSDGTSLYAWRDTSTGATTRGLAQYSTALVTYVWRKVGTMTGLPVVPLDSTKLLAPFGTSLLTLTAATGATASTFATLGANVHTPVIGSDGHVYVLRDTAVMYAYDSAGNLSWTADPNGSIFRAATMDCSGRIFGASNGVNGAQSLVWAVLTDDSGLGDTPWPSYRRDSRNTGNTSFTRYGSRTASGCTQ